MTTITIMILAALAMTLQHEQANRAAIFVYVLFYRLADTIAVIDTAAYYPLIACLSVLFVTLLALLPKVTTMILLLAATEFILVGLDGIGLLAYNLGSEQVLQMSRTLTYYVAIAQAATLLVGSCTNARNDNFWSVCYSVFMRFRATLSN